MKLGLFWVQTWTSSRRVYVGVRGSVNNIWKRRENLVDYKVEVRNESR